MLPVDIKIAPVDALALVPVESVNEPLEVPSAVAPFAVARNIEPVVVWELAPDCRKIEPPVCDPLPGSTVFPLMRLILPPLPLYPSPMASKICPPRPELDIPVESMTEPDAFPASLLSPPDFPVETMMLPLTPAEAELNVEISTFPLDEIELYPLDISRLPPEAASLNPAAK